MMPSEDENRRDVLLCIAPIIIPAATILLELGMDLSGCLKKSATKKHSVSVLRAVAGLIAQSTLHYRALFAVAEYGFEEPAAMLARALFEDVLAERFILHRPRHAHRVPPSVRGQLKRLAIPKGRKAADFRADLYAVFQCYRFALNWQRSIGVAAFSKTMTVDRNQRMEQIAKEIEKSIGKRWAKIMRQTKSYSGLSVADLCELYRLGDLHKGVYSELSMSSHSNRGLSYIRTAGDNEGACNVRFHGDLNKTLLAVQLGTALYGQFLDDLAVEFKHSIREQLTTLAQIISAECDRHSAKEVRQPTT